MSVSLFSYEFSRKGEMGLKERNFLSLATHLGENPKGMLLSADLKKKNHRKASNLSQGHNLKLH